MEERPNITGVSPVLMEQGERIINLFIEYCENMRRGAIAAGQEDRLPDLQHSDSLLFCFGAKLCAVRRSRE